MPPDPLPPHTTMRTLDAPTGAVSVTDVPDVYVLVMGVKVGHTVTQAPLSRIFTKETSLQDPASLTLTKERSAQAPDFLILNVIAYHAQRDPSATAPGSPD